VFSHVGPLASGIVDGHLPVLDRLGFVHLVCLAPFDLVGPVVWRLRLASAVTSTGWLKAPLEPENLSVGESSPG
jgi:hypothetical protein